MGKYVIFFNAICINFEVISGVSPFSGLSGCHRCLTITSQDSKSRDLNHHVTCPDSKSGPFREKESLSFN